MSKQAIITVNERTYVINAFEGEEGWGYLPRLMKYVFPFIGYAFNEDTTDSKIMDELMVLLSGDNAKEVERLVVELVSKITVDNQVINFNKEFSQNYDALLKLVLEVIKLNYFNSFQKLVMNLQK